MTDRKKVHVNGKKDGKKVRWVEEGKTIIKTYDMRKKNPIFTKMKKKLKRATRESNGVSYDLNGLYMYENTKLKPIIIYD